MDLPALPKKYKRKEADVTPHVMRWFFENYPDNYAVEVKVGKNKTKPHQDLALDKVHAGTFDYKLPDMGQRNPFDFIGLKKDVHAYVVTCNGRQCRAVGRHGNVFDFKV